MWQIAEMQIQMASDEGGVDTSHKQKLQILSFAVCHFSLVICHLPFAIHLPLVSCHLSCDMFPLPFVICHVPLVICHGNHPRALAKCAKLQIRDGPGEMREACHKGCHSTASW